jgi:hypothetical protein
MLPAQVQYMMALQNGSPLAIPQHLKKMQPSAPGPQMRISSGDGMRPPTVSATNSQHQSSPPQPIQPQSTTSPIVNQGSPAPSPVPILQPPPNGIPQNGQHAVGGLSLQQVQNLKSAFATLSVTEMAALNGGRPLPASYLMPNMQLPPNTNISLKLPNTRQTQWAMAAQLGQQRPASVVNGLDGQLNGAPANGMLPLAGHFPSRFLCVRHRLMGNVDCKMGFMLMQQHSLSPHLQSSPTLPNISQSQRICRQEGQFTEQK